MQKSDKIKNIESALKGQGKAERITKPVDYLSSGSTLINLACTGRSYGAFLKGHFYFLVGSSSSGKTFTALTCLAEAAKNPSFDEYDFIFDNIEQGALMDWKRYFGTAVAERIKAPRYVDGSPVNSKTVEDFQFNVDDAVKRGKPFIYIADSENAMGSESEQKKFQERKRFSRSRKGKPPAGDYGDGKAKKHSSGMREIVAGLQSSGSILILIGQSRDNIAMFAKDKETYSGGRALKFYAALQIWTSIAYKLKRSVRGQKMNVGIVCKAEIKKNRLSGKEWSVNVPIYFDYGIDDVGSMVSFLKYWGHWSGSEETVTAKEFEFSGPEMKLVKKIEEEGLEKELKSIVIKVWREIEEALSLKRKPRYE